METGMPAGNAGVRLSAVLSKDADPKLLLNNNLEWFIDGAFNFLGGCAPLLFMAKRKGQQECSPTGPVCLQNLYTHNTGQNQARMPMARAAPNSAG